MVFSEQSRNELNLASRVANAIGRDPQEIQMLNLDITQAKRDRFIYAVTLPSDTKQPGFLKISQGKHKRLLAREIQGMNVAQILEIPTVDIITPFLELDNQNALIELGHLNFIHGELLPNDAAISEAQFNGRYGMKAARALMLITGRQIPDTVDVSLFIRKKGRLESPKTFWTVWEKHKSSVFSERYAVYRNGIISSDRLQDICAETENTLTTLLQANRNEKDKQRYLVHHDTHPRNMYYPYDDGESVSSALLLDFDQIAVTKYALLAYLVDWGDFYHRAWPNRYMQQEFIRTLLSESEFESLQNTYDLMRSIIVFGTIYSSKYYMEPSHPYHKKAVVLLQNLISNLDFLESEYHQMQGKTL